MPAPGARRQGQALVEYVIILPSLLMIILGAIQLALIFQAKSTLNYAAFLAARQGALHHGKECLGALCVNGGMRLGLAAGLTPLAARKNGAADGMGVEATQLALLAELQTGALATIKTLNPTREWAAAAMQKDPYTKASGVPNDNLMYRPTTLIGPTQSRMNLQDGNLLKIQVTYCFKLDVPFANQIIYAANSLLPASALAASALPTGWAPLAEATPLPGLACNVLNAIPAGTPGSGRYLPIVATAMVRMQSPYIGP